MLQLAPWSLQGGWEGLEDFEPITRKIRRREALRNAEEARKTEQMKVAK